VTEIMNRTLFLLNQVVQSKNRTLDNPILCNV